MTHAETVPMEGGRCGKPDRAQVARQGVQVPSGERPGVEVRNVPPLILGLLDPPSSSRPRSLFDQ